MTEYRPRNPFSFLANIYLANAMGDLCIQVIDMENGKAPDEEEGSLEKNCRIGLQICDFLTETKGRSYQIEVRAKVRELCKRNEVIDQELEKEFTEVRSVLTKLSREENASIEKLELLYSFADAMAEALTHALSTIDDEPITLVSH